MRRLMWFALGFGAAMALFAYLLSGVWVLLTAAACLILFLGLLLIRQKLHPAVFLVLAGILIGLVYSWGYDGLVLGWVKQYDGKTARLTVEATDYSFDTGYGNAVDGTVELNGRKIKTRLFYESNICAVPGDRLSLRAALRYTPEGGLQISTYHKGEGLFLLCYGQSEPELERAEKTSFRYFAAYLRRAMSKRITEIFPEDMAPFAKALLIGDDSQVSYQDNYVFQNSGIRHIIAVSGLHVSFLFTVVHFVTGKRRLPTLLAGLPILFVFAAVAGFTPSVVRACIMQGLLILSLALDRQYDPATALSFSCLVMLAINPLTITSVSFQLSVGCMIGVYLFARPIRDYFYQTLRRRVFIRNGLQAGIARWFSMSTSISISAMIFTMPLCALYFGAVTMIGIVTNLLTIWIISYIFMGIVLACLISLIWMQGGCFIAWVVSWLSRFVLFVAKMMAGIPGGSAYVGNPYTVLWIVATIFLLVAFYCSKRKAPILLASSILTLYILGIAAAWLEPRTDHFRMTAIDVGQGQCVLLQSRDQTYLVDCGGQDPEATATKALDILGAQGVHQLDGVILTHYDTDHCNAAAYLLDCISVDKLYLPDTDPEDALRLQLESKDVPITWVRKNLQLDCGEGKITIFPAKIPSEGNESSMCILFQRESCDILITGDRNIAGEEDILKQEAIGQVEVLVVGHHGAATSTGLMLLQQTRPVMAVISVGEGNFHGHPDSETIKRLERFGCDIRRTDLEGTIIIRG